MISGPLSATAKNALGLDSAVFPGNRPEASSQGGSAKEKSSAESLDLKAFADDLNLKVKMIHNVDLNFSVHEGSGQLMVKVIDGETGEVIREIPPSEILNLAARLNEMAGLIFDQVG